MREPGAESGTVGRPIEFGRVFADHMLLARFEAGRWSPPAVVEYGPLELSPALCGLHYGQCVFEGMKVCAAPDGTALLFRAGDHLRRLNRSAERMCMPTVPAELFHAGVADLVRADRSWIPHQPGRSLYLRPLLLATDERIGVRPSESYALVVLASPTAGYHGASVSLWLSRDNVRAFPGGTGAVKAAGNYGPALLAARRARKRGFDDVLWVDAQRRSFAEECGTMNVFFLLGDTVVTPPAAGTILPGITRDTVLRILAGMGRRVEVRPISVRELRRQHQGGRLRECFGTGTAASVVPVSRIGTESELFELPVPRDQSLASRLGHRLEALRTGLEGAPPGWLTAI